MVVTLVAAALVGFGIGIMAGMLGIGGGAVMVPVFRLAFGMSALGSTATSLFTIIPTSISGVVTHIRAKTCLPKLGIAMGIGGACTSPLGVWLANSAPSWTVMLATAIVIAYMSVTMLLKAIRMTPKGARPSAGASGGEDAGGLVNADSVKITGKLLAQGVAVGALAGVASGFVGLGGGFVMIPLMLSVLGLSMKLASGTSLMAVMILATPATITQCMLGNVDFIVGIAVACGSIPGASFGARLTSRMPERALRFIFSGFLFIGAILLVVNELGWLS